MISLRYFLIAALVLSLLPGCQFGFKKKSGSQATPKRLSVVNPFKIKIEGAECRLCAQELEESFLSLPEFYGVKFLPLMGDYERGYLRCYLAKGGCNIDLFLLDNILAPKGFVCDWIDGQFIGTLVERDGKRLFIVDGTEVIIFVSNNRQSYEPISDEYWHQLEKDKLIRVTAKVYRNEAGWRWMGL